MTREFVYDSGRADFPAQAHEIYRVLRDDHPIYHDSERNFWAVSRFEDVHRIASDAVRFSSEGTSLGGGELLPHIQMMDAPRHNALRNLVSLAFTPRRVGQMEPRVRTIAKELIDDLAARGSGDLLADFARHLPSRVIGEMIGVPPERRKMFLECTDQMIGVSPDSDRDNIRAPAAKIYEEFAKLLDERRRERRDDLMSALLDAEIDGEGLSQEELLGFCFVLIVAGNDTTTNLIANGAVMLAHHPDQRRVLAADPSLIPNAVEEMLRFESPAQVLPRRTTEEVEIHGVTIPAEQEIKLVWAAANRDDREFPEAERFDVSRVIRRHLALGTGLHFCLGSKLARLEARVGFEELLARIPEYELESEPQWVQSIWARAYASVPISFEPVA